MAFLEKETVLAELGTGALLRSEDFGRTWKTSTSPLDAYDFALASGRTPTPGHPFDCVLGTSPASMTVRPGNQGCFHSFESLLSVRLSPDEALLSVERDVEGKHVRERRTLSRGDGERIVREWVAASLRQETMPDCGSTTVYSASIEWSCPSGPIKKESVRLKDSSCEPQDLPSLMNVGFVPPGAYSRTLGIHQAVHEVLERTSR